MKKPKIKKIKIGMGDLAQDFIASINTLKLVGTADPRAKIIVYDNFGVKIGTTRADKKGNWVFDTPQLADRLLIFMSRHERAVQADGRT